VQKFIQRKEIGGPRKITKNSAKNIRIGAMEKLKPPSYSLIQRKTKYCAEYEVVNIIGWVIIRN
jgi:hypothetical protein